MKVLFCACVLLCTGNAAVLTRATADAFDHYARQQETAMQQSSDAEHWLWVDSHPEERARALRGEMIVVPGRRESDVSTPGGIIHDWIGTSFIPHGKIDGARAVLQDYANYKTIYKPEVIESKLLSHNDDAFRVFLRLRAEHIITVIYNTEYDVVYGQPDAKRMWVRSRSTRIAQVEDPGKSMAAEDPVGNDDGYLWRINAYWRFEERDDGLWAECRSISLSRGLPLGFGWLRGFIQQFPRDALTKTLSATGRAIAARQ